MSFVRAHTHAYTHGYYDTYYDHKKAFNITSPSAEDSQKVRQCLVNGGANPHNLIHYQTLL